MNVTGPGQDPFSLLGLGYGALPAGLPTPAAPAFADTLVELSSTGAELTAFDSSSNDLQPFLTEGEQELLEVGPGLDPATSAAGNAAAAAAAAASPAYAASLAQVLSAQQTLPELLSGAPASGDGSLFDVLA